MVDIHIWINDCILNKHLYFIFHPRCCAKVSNLNLNLVSVCPVSLILDKIIFRLKIWKMNENVPRFEVFVKDLIFIEVFYSWGDLRDDHLDLFLHKSIKRSRFLKASKVSSITLFKEDERRVDNVPSVISLLYQTSVKAPHYVRVFQICNQLYFIDHIRLNLIFKALHHLACYPSSFLGLLGELIWQSSFDSALEDCCITSTSNLLDKLHISNSFAKEHLAQCRLWRLEIHN